MTTTIPPSAFAADVLAIIRLVEPGEWTSPVDIAAAIGNPGAWRAVGNVIGPTNWRGTDADRAYAVRVLRSTGKPSPGFRYQAHRGSGPDTQVRMLTAQGVQFIRGRADATQRVCAATLIARSQEGDRPC